MTGSDGDRRFAIGCPGYPLVAGRPVEDTENRYPRVARVAVPHLLWCYGVMEDNQGNRGSVGRQVAHYNERECKLFTVDEIKLA